VNTHFEEIPPNAAAAPGGRGGRGAGPEMALVITSVSAGSPAESAGLKTGDRILEVEGEKATPKAINDLLTPAQPGNGRGGRGQGAASTTQPAAQVKKPGEKIKLRISRDGAPQDLDIELGKNVTRTYHLQTVDAPTASQSAVLKDWLRGVQ
jgi:C-terminal processing protease CtpA/Prc